MAMSSSNPRMYLDQWLATASKGTIVPHYSLFTNRVKLHCAICAETLTMNIPTETTIDSKTQAFVNFHLHRPAPNCSYCGAAVTTEAFVQHEHLCLLRPGSPGYTGASPGIPKTLDFKPVKIDESPEKAKQIIDATSKTLGSYSDEAVAKKLSALMADDKGKVIPPGKVIPIDSPTKLKWQKYSSMIDPFGVVKGGTKSVMQWQEQWQDENDETATDEELAELQEQASKLKAVENALKIKQLKAMIETLKPLAEHEKPQPKPSPIADGVMVTGRKFR